MLYSMTGYGRAEQTIGEQSFLIELRSLNSKQFDLRLQIPPILKSYEFHLRNVLSEYLERGSVECVITQQQNGINQPVAINTSLLKFYHQSLQQVAIEINADQTALLASILRLPEVVKNNTANNSTEILSEKDWDILTHSLQQAIKMLVTHRFEEGKIIEKDLLERIANIETQQKLLTQLDAPRRIKMKERLKKMLTEHVGKDNFDTNRLEQELIYYIEKIDITEEQVRLKNHCNYLRAVLQEQGNSKGKKIGFLLQEIGREINTTGSKANDFEIQKSVVLMKDELEKAKEQILNVL